MSGFLFEQRYAVLGEDFNLDEFLSIIEGRHSRLEMFMSGKEDTRVNKTRTYGGKKEISFISLPKEIRIIAMSEVGKFRI